MRSRNGISFLHRGLGASGIRDEDRSIATRATHTGERHFIRHEAARR